MSSDSYMIQHVGGSLGWWVTLGKFHNFSTLETLSTHKVILCVYIHKKLPDLIQLCKPLVVKDCGVVLVLVLSRKKHQDFQFH